MHQAARDPWRSSAQAPPLGTAAAAFGPWPARAQGSDAPTDSAAPADANQPHRPQPRPGGLSASPSLTSEVSSVASHTEDPADVLARLPPPERIAGLLQQLQHPRYYAQEHIGDGTYGAVANAVDLAHPAAREFVAHVIANKFPLPSVPRRARVARKALSEKSGAIKFVVRELSALQEIRRLQEARAAAPAGSLEREALDGVQYMLRLIDVEQRASGYPTIVTELCETTLLNFMKCFERQRAPLCCVRTFTAQLAAAIAAMHDAVGMLHRDLKPDNVLLALVDDDQGTPAIPDGDSDDDDGDAAHHRSSPWQHVDPASPHFGSAASLTTPLHRSTRVGTDEPDTQARGFDAVDPGTEPRLQPYEASNASQECSCPFCGSPVSYAEAAAALESFRGPPPSAAKPGSRPRRRQADHEPETIVGSYIEALFDANGVERLKPDQRRGPAEFALRPGAAHRGPRLRLEVRVCDFGSACFIGPQPDVATHGVGAGEYPPTSFPACGDVTMPEPRESEHVMAPMPTPQQQRELEQAGHFHEAIDRVAPQRRPYVTHGWTTLQYRAPEDMLSAAESMEEQALARQNRGAPDVFRETRPRLGPSVDVWALGAIVAEMLSGQILFYEPTVFSLGDVGDAPWAQLMGVLRVVGAPVCGGCATDPTARECRSGRCWNALLSVASSGQFVRPASARVQMQRGAQMIDHTHEVDRRTGTLACLPQFQPTLHTFAKGHLARRCVELDFAIDGGADAGDAAEPAAERNGLIDAIAAGITPAASPTFDLLSRMLILDPSRRIASWELREHPVVAGVLRRDATHSEAAQPAEGATVKHHGAAMAGSGMPLA